MLTPSEISKQSTKQKEELPVLDQKETHARLQTDQKPESRWQRLKEGVKARKDALKVKAEEKRGRYEGYRDRLRAARAVYRQRETIRWAGYGAMAAIAMWVMLLVRRKLAMYR